MNCKCAVSFVFFLMDAFIHYYMNQFYTQGATPVQCLLMVVGAKPLTLWFMDSCQLSYSCSK